jgi:superfamily II DNA or RNA helicase
VKNLSKEKKDILKEKLTIRNPKIGEAVALGLFSKNMKPTFTYFREVGDSIIIPLGGIPYLLENISDNEEVSLNDNRFHLPNPEYFNKVLFTGSPRDYQKDALNAALGKSYGVVEAKTGSGKSIIIVALSILRKVNTLILVNTKELAEQMKSNFLKFSNIPEEEIGFIGSGKYEVKPITIGLLQTVVKLDNKKIDELNSFFSQVITDETHIVAAVTYYNALNKLKAKYKFGFSATPFRTDGLTKVINLATGPNIHKVPDEKLSAYLIKPRYIPIATEYYYPMFNTTDYQNMLTHLGDDQKRNKLIIDTYEHLCKGEPTVFLCSRVSQAEKLQAMLPGSELLHSSLTKKKRTDIMDNVRKGKTKIIVSTFALFSTGIDWPDLTCLFMCSPVSSLIVLKQTGGRLMRPHESKTWAKIYDFVDLKIGMLFNQAKARKKVLENL